ncbi:hypothetical protein GCM10027515_32400 [Schumannella luteola]
MLDLSAENVSPALIGTAVDYLVRLAEGVDPTQAFKVSLRGAQALGPRILDRAQKDIAALAPGRIDEAAVVAACRLASFDVGYRAGAAFYNPKTNVDPDERTSRRILAMVERSRAFFQSVGPVTKDGFTFPGGYTDVITNGDGDFLTADTVWDFKVSVKDPTIEHTLQLLIYFLMGKQSRQSEFASVSHLGVFNPRLNREYRAAVADIDASLLLEVSRDVIGYPAVPALT